MTSIACGVISAPKKRPLEQRLAAIFDGLTEVVCTHAPRSVAVEDIFFAKYANAALKLGHARGVAILVAAQADLEVFAYPPAVVKRTVAGMGNADKEQVARLVGAILGMKTLPGIDARDACAIAITHLQAARSRSALLRAPKR